jgi:hypothetical protein
MAQPLCEPGLGWVFETTDKALTSLTWSAQLLTTSVLSCNEARRLLTCSDTGTGLCAGRISKPLARLFNLPANWMRERSKRATAFCYGVRIQPSG